MFSSVYNYIYEEFYFVLMFIISFIFIVVVFEGLDKFDKRS